MQHHRLDPAAYGRVTHPERYQVVVDTARRLIRQLARTYDVAPVRRLPTVAFSSALPATEQTHRFVPSRGAPIEFLLTDFPGVALHFGEWGEAVFPVCGCDACDEDPAGLCRSLTATVESLVEDGYREKLTRRWLLWSPADQESGRYSRRRLERGGWRRLGQRGTHHWPPWPQHGNAFTDLA